MNWACTLSMTEFTQTQGFFTVWTVTFWERDQNQQQKMDPKEGIMGLIGRMLTSDGQQFILLGEPSIIIGQTATWTDFHIQLFLKPLTVMTTSQSHFLPREYKSYLAEVTKTGI